MIMGVLSANLALALLSTLGSVSGQNGTNSSEANAAGPTWNHADYESSPPVYPTRESRAVTLAEVTPR